MKNKHIEWKDLTITKEGDYTVISNGKNSVKLLCFSEEALKKLQQIAEQVYAEQAATSRHKLAARAM